MMPGLNGTGPRGLGPMTGGGFGLCTGSMPTPYSRYSPKPATFNQNPYPYNTQNPYTQNYGLSNTRFQAPNQYSLQTPYYSGSPYGWGMGRGLGMGLGWRRGFGAGLGYGRGLGLGWRRGFF